MTLAPISEICIVVWTIKSRLLSKTYIFPLELVNDAWKDLFDCAVIISNDGELAEALRIVSQEQCKKIILLTPPRFKKKRSKALKKYASISLTIKNTHLAESQLPDPIPGTNIRKPASWNST